jgi:hypothetical protein
MASTDVELRETGLEISHIRGALADIETVEEAAEQTDRAKAIETYAHAKKSREMVNQAVELRIWAERRAGEVAISEGLSFSQLRVQYGVGVHDASRWIHLAFVSSEFLENVIRDTRESGRDLTLNRVLAAVINASKSRIAPGIWALADGRYQFVWKEGKTRRTKIHSAKSDEHAIELLAKFSRTIAPPTPGAPDLATVYGQIRIALSRCDRAMSIVAPKARHHVTNAITSLHAAEDAIQLAKKENEVRR